MDLEFIQEVIAKAALIIGLVFCISPIPTLWQAVTINKDALKSMSIPGTVMGLTCSTVVGVFCQINGLGDCVSSCWMFIASCGLSLLIYFALFKQLSTFFFLAILQLVLAYAVQNVFSETVTNVLMVAMNTLACVLMPLDQVDKVLATRDLSYVSYLMNFLNALSCLLWGLYYQMAGAIQLAVPNYAGLVCSFILIPACLYGSKTFQKDHWMVQISENSVNILYRMPSKLLSSKVKEKVENDNKTPKESKKGEKKANESKKNK